MPNQITLNDIQDNLTTLQGRLTNPDTRQEQTLILALTTCAQALAGIVERLDRLDETAKSIDRFASKFETTMITLDKG